MRCVDQSSCRYSELSHREQIDPALQPKLASGLQINTSTHNILPAIWLFLCFLVSVAASSGRGVCGVYDCAGKWKSVNAASKAERERERKFNLSIQPALAYEDVSILESSTKLRMAAKQ